MIQLNLPKCDLKIKSNENKLFIFDIIRKKYVVLTPEEWVRQHYIHFLIEEKHYPKSRIAVEKQIRVLNTLKRFDILVFDKHGKPDIIVECKAPNISIDQKTFDQIARYNLTLDTRVVAVTNGLAHYYAKIDKTERRYLFLKDLPEYAK